MTDRLRFIPLGGLSEVGMNCAAMSIADTTIAIDCGIGFTDEAGADMMHPDFRWLYEQGERLQAIVITHGHEDHIGALPYFLKERKVPVYAPPYAAALIKDRLAEHRLEGIDLHIGGAGTSFDIGPFHIERFGVHHSIADATGLILETPVGTVVHTGDFKIESDPCEGQRFDRDRLQEVATDGVRLLLSDSTGADTDGRARIERDADAALEAHVTTARGRVLVATFSSNVFRLRAALRIARTVGRKVCLLGMSVNKHTDAARSLGLIPPTESLLVSFEEAEAMPREQIMIVAGGTQGERGSSLTRLARDEHSHLHVEAGDTVIFSSRIIPGNELAVFDVINRLERRGVDVITRHRHPEVHASGHGTREEEAEMIRLLRPQAFVPVHGTHHHLRRHAELAADAGVSQIEILRNGRTLELEPNAMSIGGSVPVGRVYLERTRPLDDGVMDDRRAMAAGGVLSLVVTLEGERIRAIPRVLSAGVVGRNLRDHLGEQVASHVFGKLKRRRFRTPGEVEGAVTDAARGFVYYTQRKRPLITVMVEDGR
ncbi:MAG: ribonuclease J [Polyangiales bacterium]